MKGIRKPTVSAPGSRPLGAAKRAAIVRQVVADGKSVRHKKAERITPERTVTGSGRIGFAHRLAR